MVQCYPGLDTLSANLQAAVAAAAAAAPPPTPQEAAAARKASCQQSKKCQPRGLLTPEGAEALVGALLADQPRVTSRVCRVTAWPKAVSSLVLAALTARGVRLSATAHDVTVSVMLYTAQGDGSGDGGGGSAGVGAGAGVDVGELL